MTDATAVDGTCGDRFEPVRELLAANVGSGLDAGAAVAVVHDGELVVDLWGGSARPGVPWQRDTTVQVWSVSKVMAALAVLVLIDRGQIDVDESVASYWPAFGTAGKSSVTVRQLMSHASTVPGWSRPATVEEICDLELSESWLASDAPWYEPGSGIAYQALNHGHLLDGVVRGATGRTLAEVLETEVMGPVGGGFHLGVPEAGLDGCADLTLLPRESATPLADIAPDSMLVRAMFNPMLTPEVCNGPAWRRSAVGGVSGQGTARGIALAQSALSHGGVVGGHSLLSSATVDRVWGDAPLSGVDQVLMVPLSYSFGYALPGPTTPLVPSGRSCWWTGWGGAVLINDADRRTTLCYTPNALDAGHMVTSTRTEGYVRTILEALA